MIPRKGVHVPKSHPPYPPEFRAEAVRLVREGGRSPDHLAFGRRCRQAGIAVAMGSVGDCFDNAVMESF